MSKERQREWYYENHERELAKRRAYQEANRERVREMNRDNHRRHQQEDPEGYKLVRRFRQLKHKYGITQQQYDDMYNSQQGLCAICIQPFDIFAVDHNHITGRIRGLLCKSCNTLLANAKEDSSLLQRAIDYLAVHDLT
jgi:hypothetical protein